MTDRTNLILIIVDQWRADSFGITGHPFVETPNIDNLFAGGTVFDRAYAAVPSCIAARASIMTGLHQAHHGRVGYLDGVPWEYEHTLAGLLTGAGYQTHCVGKMHVSPPRKRLGFESVELHDGYLSHTRTDPVDQTVFDDYLPWLRDRTGAPEADIIDAGLGCNGYTVRPWPYDDLSHPSAWTVTRGIDFLRWRDPTNPFFLNLSFHRPHPPLDAPQWALDLYQDVEVPEPVVGDWVDPDRPISLYSMASSPIPESKRQIERTIRGYWAQLSFIDNQLNRLIHALQEARLFDSTAILLVGDHGEMLYDHRSVGKMVGNEASTRVPFMLRLPRSAGGTKKRRVAAPVELRDVLPTLCALGGVDIPVTIDGASVLPLANGDDEWRTLLHGEHSGSVIVDNHWLTDGRTKYLRETTSGREFLFDIDVDADEEHDLASERPDEVAIWRQRLIDELDGRPEGFVVDGELASEPLSTAIVPGVLSGDDEIQAGQKAVTDSIRSRIAGVRPTRP